MHAQPTLQCVIKPQYATPLPSKPGAAAEHLQLLAMKDSNLVGRADVGRGLQLQACSDVGECHLVQLCARYCGSLWGCLEQLHLHTG